MLLRQFLVMFLLLVLLLEAKGSTMALPLAVKLILSILWVVECLLVDIGWCTMLRL